MELFVPGRLCLMGEHSDWAGAWRRVRPSIRPGRCLVVGTRQGIRARARARSDRQFRMSLPSQEGERLLFVPLDGLEEVIAERGFFSYVAGVVEELRVRRGPLGGLELRVLGADLPVRKGLSSSAAACVLVARAFNRVQGLGCDVEEEMDLAHHGERRAGSECGRMDQVCALGPEPRLLTFDGDEMGIERLEAGGPIHLLVVDLRGAKDTRRILADLQGCFPDAPGALAAGVREALGPANERLVGAGRRLLEQGEARGLGELMSEAQALFDARVAPACSELAAPRLHAVLESAAVRELAWGGKGVGSQGDGCAQLVARGPDEARELRRRLASEQGLPSLDLALPIRLPG